MNNYYLLKEIFKKPKILEWNNNKAGCLKVPLTTANGIIESFNISNAYYFLIKIT